MCSWHSCRRMKIALLILLWIIYRTTKKGEGDDKSLDNFEGGCGSFWGRGYFFDLLGVHIYEQKISFHHLLSFLAIVWLLLHCCHSETTFVVNLWFYNGNTVVTFSFLKSRIGWNLFTFLLVLLGL